MNTELEWTASQLHKAMRPEDVFGGVGSDSYTSLSAVKKAYHAMAKIVHPDLYQTEEERRVAHLAFSQLVEWFGQAQEKIRCGSYGKEQILLRTNSREYQIGIDHITSDRFNFYPCTFRESSQHHTATLRVTRDPRNNDLSQNEARILSILRGSRDAVKFQAYLPNLIDSFVYFDGMHSYHASVFERYEGWYSLADVHKAHPCGIDPKDMAWMWRRLLVALGFAHANSVIHGAVLPANILIQPEQHGLMIVHWFSAVYKPSETGESISEIDPNFSAWYPEEVLNGEIPSFGTDIAMSARCMIYLLGGDVYKTELPTHIPKSLCLFLKGSMLPGKRTPQDAWAVKEEFDELLERLWGVRKFHPFKMSLTH